MDPNIYGYVSNNSINIFDLFGLEESVGVRIGKRVRWQMNAGLGKPTNWGETVKNLGEKIDMIIESIIKNMQPAPYDERCRRAREHVMWYVDKSGLKTLPETAAAGTLVIVVSEAAIWGYAIYPAINGAYVEVMVAAGTPTGQEIIKKTMHSIESAFPGTTPRMDTYGALGYAIGQWLGTNKW
jgi:hypothetical protein